MVPPSRLTDSDFGQMDWHDATVHSFVILPEQWEIAFDIDYIFEWIQPTPGELSLSFRVAPCTLVFSNVFGYTISLHSESPERITIQEVKREQPRCLDDGGTIDWEWRLECLQGEITFRASEFKQFVRREPMTIDRQTLSAEFARGRLF